MSATCLPYGRWRWAIGLTTACLLGLGCASVSAQDMKESKNAPITVEADPVLAPSGSEILLRGKTVAIDSKKPVQLTVTWLRPLNPGPAGPAPAPASSSAAYQADGSFQVKHLAGREGVYRVDALSPDGSGKASAEFKVAGFASWSDNQTEAMEKALDLGNDLLGNLEQIVDSQPPSPAKQDFKDKVPALRAALAERKAALGELRGAFEIYGRIVKASPATAPAFQKLTRSFTDFQRKSEELTPKMKQALADSKKSNRGCEDLVKVEEGFKLMSAMFNLAQAPAKILIAFGADLATSVAADKAPPNCEDTCKLGFTQAVKQHLWLRPDVIKAATKAKVFGNYVSNLPGLAADLSVFVDHALFDKYCERFEGPVSGKMKAQYFKDGEKWWEYTTQIEGKMTLVYKKGSDLSKGVAMSGHLAGTGTRFTVKEDALRVLKRKVLSGAVVVGGTTAPLGIPFSDFEGVMAMQALPTAFFIPVEGELVGEKLKLTLGPSRTDFNTTYTVAKGRYAVGGVLSMGVIVFTSFEVGFDTARGFIDKATDSDLGPITIPVAMGKTLMKGERTFTAQRNKNIAKGEYEVKITLCNPKCP
jgi:hypothetical protein